MWEHEKLTVYAKTVEVAVQLHEIAHSIPHRHADLRDQLRRAASSVVLNLAEGANEFSPSEKARFYRMARRSAAECAAVLDLLARLLPSSAKGGHAKTALGEVAAMLTRLIQAQPARR